jgi:hypothetical protein
VVTKVPVAPESRIAVRGGATSVAETRVLDRLMTEAPPRQVEEGESQKQRLVLPPCMLVKVAVD